MSADAIEVIQREVHVALGECVLRLQRYERLMKVILASSEVSGPIVEPATARDERAQKLATQSLGALVNSLFESYVVSEGPDEPAPDGTDWPPDQISIRFRHYIAMTDERRGATQDAIRRLVAMRNELVHHFTERFDLASEAGCFAATQHLAACIAQIKGHHTELQQWAESMRRARSIAHSFVQSDAFADLFIDGSEPDGTVDWRRAGIVLVLSEAARALSNNEWTCLDAARRWIEERYPAQVPEKYGCRTWSQVLHVSRRFELRYRMDNGGRKAAWYRERA